MSKSIEVRLRVPKNSKAPILDENGYPLDPATFRWRRLLTVPTIPKSGEAIELVAGEDKLPATVVRADWNEADGRFVVACQYANRSIPVDQQNALVADPEWTIVPLL